MEQGAPETVAPVIGDEIHEVGAEEKTEFEKVSLYVEQNPQSTNTQLFSLLALLKAYVPESYLLMSECQQILGPPDPIHGGPPFEERMEPFIVFINPSELSFGRVCLSRQESAQEAVKLFSNLGISRRATVEKLFSLCGDQDQPHLIQFIKDLLTKREMGDRGKEKFSRLIQDIMQEQNFYQALFVLKTASYKFKQNPIFPQTIARLYYIENCPPQYEKAEQWAMTAIQRAPSNSYVADTLGQIYKNHLLWKAKQSEEIINVAKKALEAFKDVENKAEREEDPEMRDTAGTDSTSNSFNNRGLFGFIQVAKIVFKKLSAPESRPFIQKMEVTDKFDFFEWYLTYSQPDMTTLEPDYFWMNVAVCYKHYTEQTAAESTSFPGLLDCLNHGLFMLRGRRTKFEENAKTASDLEAIQGGLKATYEANVDDVKVAQRYILSNIILSNRVPESPQLTPVQELQAIIHRFLETENRRRTPEFYLLVLLLFWPEEQPRVVQEVDDDEGKEQQATEGDGSEDRTWEDEHGNEEQEAAGDPVQLPFRFDPDLQQYVTLMEKAFERAKYAKYLRGRYLLPLFFLGKGSGLSRWIHKSRLDAIVERQVDADESTETKRCRINDMWRNGEVWQVPEVQEILLPVRVEHEQQEMFVCAGGKKINASPAVQSDASTLSPTLFYLGFTIRGPVVFKVGVPHIWKVTNNNDAK